MACIAGAMWPRPLCAYQRPNSLPFATCRPLTLAPRRSRHILARVSRSGKSGDESGKGFGAAPVAPPSSSPDLKVGGGPRAEPASRGPRDPRDAQFEERLAAVRKAAAEKRQAQQARLAGPIDYDNPEEDTSGVASFLTKDLGSKIGVSVAAAVFAAIFAFGDILPPPEAPSSKASSSASFSAQLSALNPGEREELQAQLTAFEAALAQAPEDRDALEGAAVSSVELGDLSKADSLLSRLEKVASDDVEVLRLHAEVQLALGKYGDSTATYRLALKLPSAGGSVELLQGLAEALVADNKPREAVNELLARRESAGDAASTASDIDPVQLELLLGKAYSAWGKPGDAAAVYDRLTQERPEDFRGYLAKGLLLRGQGKEGDAQRMFLQAKFFAPDAAKGLVDRLSKATA